MTESWPCPACGNEVKATHTDPLGPTPELMHSRCGACDVALLRGVDADPDQGWAVEITDNSPRQCRARLVAFAREQDLEFEEPQESSPGIWRCYLWVKNGPDDPRGERTARVWGSGTSEREALLMAVSDAEGKGLPRMSDREGAP